jgi:hypothetical protein
MRQIMRSCTFSMDFGQPVREVDIHMPQFRSPALSRATLSPDAVALHVLVNVIDRELMAMQRLP